MPGGHSKVRVDVTDVGDACVLTLDGALDATTYIPIRDAIVKAALDEPLVLVIDVTELTVREDPAWAVFTSARWQLAEWPNVPIGLACAHEHGRNALKRNGIARYVPVYPTREAALAELSADGRRRYRRCAKVVLPAERSSIRRCRELSAQWLTEWLRADFTHVVAIVVTEVVEAALDDTDSDFSFRVETDGSTVSVAVQHVGILRRPHRKSTHDNVSGLDLVAAHSRAWGHYATTTGNTVWAVVGPENRF